MNYKEDFSSIKKASGHINELLQAKGYIDLNDAKQSLNSRSLLFYSIDYSKLTDFNKINEIIGRYMLPSKEDESSNVNGKVNPEDVEVICEKIKKTILLNDNLINNDKNAINIIYSLLKALDIEVEKKEQYDAIIKQKEQTIQSLKQENKLLNTKINHRLTQDIDKSIKLRIKVQELQEIKVENSTLNIELKKLKSSNKTMKSNHRIELRKKDLEISKLKDKLLDRKISQSTVSYLNNKSDVILTGGASSTTNENAINMVEPLANGPVNKFSSNITPELVRSFVDEEVERLMIDSSDLITNLTVTNGANLKLLTNSKNYLSLLNDYLMLLITSFKSLVNAPKNFGNTFDANDYISLLEDLVIKKPPPASKYFFEDSNGSSHDDTDGNTTIDITKTLTNLTSVGELQTQLMSNLDTLYSTISSLVHIPANKREQTNFMGVNILDKRAFASFKSNNDDNIDSHQGKDEYTTGLEIKVETLKQELVETRQNWQRALALIEKWKQHRKNSED